MTLFLSVLDANLYFLFNVEECSGRSRKGARGAWPPLFLETAPPYLRVWMTPPPYPKVWIRHWSVPGQLVENSFLG